MNLTVSSSPHIRGNLNTCRIMLDVVLALLPALAVGIWVQGTRAAVVALICTGTAIASEWLFCKITNGPNTVADGSSIVTGLLLAMSLPSTVFYWQAALGSAFAIIIAKALFGGLGQNIFIEALAARAFLMLIFPIGLTYYPALDGMTSATSLHHMVMPALPEVSLLNALIGNHSGSIGETSALALLLGGTYLVCRKVISIQIPTAYLGTVALLTLMLPKGNPPIQWMLYSLFSGGIMLGAIFMATDYATSPVTPVGRLIFGAGCGALTVFFRYFGLFPEGVTYAILIMNALARLIDRHTAPRRFGTKKEADFQ